MEQYWRPKWRLIESTWKYITWGIKLEDLILQVYLSYLRYLMFTGFAFQQPQWSDIGGQNGGEIKRCYKYIMWGYQT